MVSALGDEVTAVTWRRQRERKKREKRERGRSSGGSHGEERKESREDYGGGARREAPPQENITRGATGTAA